LRAFFLFRGLLGKGADGSRGELHLHAIDALGLDIDLEGSASGDIGMAPLVPDGGSATGQLTGSTHTFDCLISRESVLWNRVPGKDSGFFEI
jgi:hypothetical protein